MNKVYCKECKFLRQDWDLYYGPDHSAYYCSKTVIETWNIEESWKDRPEEKKSLTKLKPHIQNKNNDCELWEAR